MADPNFTDFNDFDDRPLEECRRRKMNLFYIIDVSGSMTGDKIQSINKVMPQALQIASEISESNKDNAEIVASALLFSNGTKWMYDEPINCEGFKWIDQKAVGGTDMGEACLELEKALHRKGPKAQLNSISGHKTPAVILITDGEPTDNYELGLQILKGNNWFRSAYKIAIAIGNDCNVDNLVKFTGSKELVIGINDVEALREMIKVVTTVISSLATPSTSVESDELLTMTEEIERMISNATDNYAGAVRGDDIDTFSQPYYFD